MIKLDDCHYLFRSIQVRRSYFIKEQEEYQKSSVPPKTGGNRTKYSDIYKNKKQKKKSKSFWAKYRVIISGIFLAICSSIAMAFTGYNLYKKYKQEPGKQIIEKLASKQMDQKILNELSKKLAEEYIIPQFNKSIPNNYDYNTNFNHINREFTLFESSICDQIYDQPRTAWNILLGVCGSGLTSTFKDAYNYILKDIGDVLNDKSTKYKKETVKYKSFLYLNFQEISHSKNILESLIKYHWGNKQFNIKHYQNLPENIDEFDILRKALLISLNKEYVKNGKKQSIVLVIDSLDELITKDVEFKYWLSLFGGIVQQRICSIISVSSNNMGQIAISQVLEKEYGPITNINVECKTAKFFSVKEILQILKINMLYADSKLLANKLYEITKGYPLLLNKIINAMKTNKLLINHVINDNKHEITKWFDNWYENEYFIKYLIPTFKVMLIREMMNTSQMSQQQTIKKLIKLCKMKIINDDGITNEEGKELSQFEKLKDEIDEIDEMTIEQIGKALEFIGWEVKLNQIGVFLPPYITQNINVSLTLPIIRDYWITHSVDHIYNKAWTIFDESLKKDESSWIRFLLPTQS